MKKNHHPPTNVSTLPLRYSQQPSVQAHLRRIRRKLFMRRYHRDRAA